MLCLLGLIFKIPIVEQLMVSTQAAKRASRYTLIYMSYILRAISSADQAGAFGYQHQTRFLLWVGPQSEIVVIRHKMLVRPCQMEFPLDSGVVRGVIANTAREASLMSVFRSPIYLDIDLLVPLANYHDIEVMVDVALSQRDRGERTGKAGATVGLPFPGSPGFELGGTKGSESEITQQRTVKDHPAYALNRLLDQLTKANDITDLPASVITRHQIVQCDGEWEISPATDVGAMLTSMVTMASQNPSMWESSEPPAEFYELVSSEPERGSVVLETTLDGDEPLNVLVLLDSGCLVGRANLDSLEDDRTVFGQVDTFLPEGSQYSLEKFFLSGFSRAIRRNISAEQLLSGMEASFGKPMTIDDLKIDGPLVVVKPIAIY